MNSCIFKINSLDSHVSLKEKDSSFFRRLTFNHYLKINCKVCLIENISVDHRLVNGTNGILRKIEFSEECVAQIFNY